MRLQVFYAWQKDRPVATNHDFIGGCLDAATAQLRADGRVTASVDRDTRGVPGAPAISDTIIEKIASADAYVFDLSIVGTYGTKAVPNANVVLELGVAIGMKGWERIILLMNDAFGGPEQLPFDIRHRRIATYTQAPEDPLDGTHLTALLDMHLRDVIAYLARTPAVAKITKEMLTSDQRQILQYLARREPGAAVIAALVSNLGLNETVAIGHVGHLYDYGLLDASTPTREGPRYRLSERGREFVEQEGIV